MRTVVALAILASSVDAGRLLPSSAGRVCGALAAAGLQPVHQVGRGAKGRSLVGRSLLEIEVSLESRRSCLRLFWFFCVTPGTKSRGSAFCDSWWPAGQPRPALPARPAPD